MYVLYNVQYVEYCALYCTVYTSTRGTRARVDKQNCGSYTTRVGSFAPTIATRLTPTTTAARYYRSYFQLLL